MPFLKLFLLFIIFWIEGAYLEELSSILSHIIKSTKSGYLQGLSKCCTKICIDKFCKEINCRLRFSTTITLNCDRAPNTGQSVRIPCYSHISVKSAHLVTLETKMNTPSKYYHTYKYINN